MDENEQVARELSETAPEDTATKKNKKKKRSRAKTVIITLLCVILGLILLLVAAFFILKEVGRGSMTNDGTEVDFSNIDNADQSEGGYVRYNGQLYKYNTDISCVLLMGIDDYEPDGERHQTDVNVLAVMDPVNQKISMIAISRDAMCDMEIYDDDTGEFVGMANAQLALAYSYGDTAEKSCELTVKAVSNLFFGIEIPAYASIYLAGLSDIVDSVGGVNVVPQRSFGRFVAGQEVCLKGSLTEEYIRPRAHTVEGNNDRMQRQNQLLCGLVRKALTIARRDPTQVVDIYGSVSDNVSTDLGLSMMVYLAAEAAGMSFDGNIHMVQGESVLGEGDHAEFYVDEDALFELILDIFYIQVKE